MDQTIAVETDWLESHLGDDLLAVVDVRLPQFYLQGHVPGGLNLPVFFLSGPGGGPPVVGSIAARLGQLGISHDHYVVACDDGASPSAASLFRVLRLLGHRAVSVLNGGVTKWRHEGRDLEYASTQPAPARYAVGRPDRSIGVSREEVLHALHDHDTVIVDTRSPAEYLGLQPSASRDGHIPGAINVEWSDNLTRTDEGIAVLRGDEELRGMYLQAGVTPDKRVIVYCQVGNRASETYWVLKKLGYPNVVTYLPGWQEWGNRQDTPVEE